MPPAAEVKGLIPLATSKVPRSRAADGGAIVVFVNMGEQECAVV